MSTAAGRTKHAEAILGTELHTRLSLTKVLVVVEEIANLRKEAQSFCRNNDPAKLAFQKIFSADIQNLLDMGDMWKHREPPVPLDYDQVISGTFILDRQGSSKAKEERAH
ncbi:hypothetical protein F5050DRAFT_1811008 [Lentinula boryana]|uniref:Uncharacterized protein n=1 Tax=Lentinula boryana TaxID=40481 RepID=A0ABQ8Q2R5_9AGAR|nr:hypothetical protein F5050DRAFT_1811008 [Lentinula boryana]